MFALALGLPILGLMVIILLLVEVRHYRAGRHLISRRRFALRLAAGLLMLALLAAVFVGLFLLGLRDARGNPPLFLSFWSGCLVAAIALVWLMLADMREVVDRSTQRQHQVWRDMARFIARQVSRDGRGGSGPGAEGDG
jgi:hypothetical protein